MARVKGERENADSAKKPQEKTVEKISGAGIRRLQALVKSWPVGGCWRRFESRAGGGREEGRPEKKTNHLKERLIVSFANRRISGCWKQGS